MAGRKAEHGTPSGYAAHYRTWKTPVCGPCREAHSRAMAAYRDRKRTEAEAARTGKHLSLVPPAPDEFGEPGPPPADPDAPPGPIEVALRNELERINGEFQWKETLCAVSIRMAKHLDEGRPDIASAATGRLTELLDRLWPKLKDGPSGTVFSLGGLGEPD